MKHSDSINQNCQSLSNCQLQRKSIGKTFKQIRLKYPQRAQSSTILSIMSLKLESSSFLAESVLHPRTMERLSLEESLVTTLPHPLIQFSSGLPSKVVPKIPDDTPPH